MSQRLGTLPAQVKYSINICGKRSNSVGGKGGDLLKKEEEFNNVNISKPFGEAKVRAETRWQMQHLQGVGSVVCLNWKQIVNKDQMNGQH